MARGGKKSTMLATVLMVGDVDPVNITNSINYNMYYVDGSQPIRRERELSASAEQQQRASSKKVTNNSLSLSLEKCSESIKKYIAAEDMGKGYCQICNFVTLTVFISSWEDSSLGFTCTVVQCGYEV